MILFTLSITETMVSYLEASSSMTCSPYKYRSWATMMRTLVQLSSQMGYFQFVVKRRNYIPPNLCLKNYHAQYGMILQWMFSRQDYFSRQLQCRCERSVYTHGMGQNKSELSTAGIQSRLSLQSFCSQEQDTRKTGILGMVKQFSSWPSSSNSSNFFLSSTFTSLVCDSGRFILTHSSAISRYLGSNFSYHSSYQALIICIQQTSQKICKFVGCYQFINQMTAYQYMRTETRAGIFRDGGRGCRNSSWDAWPLCSSYSSRGSGLPVVIAGWIGLWIINKRGGCNRCVLDNNK